MHIFLQHDLSSLDTASGFDQNDLEAHGKTLNTQNAPQAALPSSVSQPFILP